MLTKEEFDILETRVNTLISDINTLLLNLETSSKCDLVITNNSLRIPDQRSRGNLLKSEPEAPK